MREKTSNVGFALHYGVVIHSLNCSVTGLFDKVAVSE